MSLLTALTLSVALTDADCTPVIVHSAPKAHVIHKPTGKPVKPHKRVVHKHRRVKRVKLPQQVCHQHVPPIGLETNDIKLDDNIPELPIVPVNDSVPVIPDFESDEDNGGFCPAGGSSSGGSWGAGSSGGHGGSSGGSSGGHSVPEPENTGIFMILGLGAILAMRTRKK